MAQPGRMEDLVGVHRPDAGDQRAVEQQRPQLGVPAQHHLAELRPRHRLVERIGPELLQRRHLFGELVGRHDEQLEAADVVDETELTALAERDHDPGALGQLVLDGLAAELAAVLEVDDQDVARIELERAAAGRVGPCR